MQKPDIAIIISVYRDVRALRLILLGLERQVFKNFEVIIAEDAMGDEMRTCIHQAGKRFSFPIKHVFQTDEGFRKCRALNAAIKASEADYLVFTDGDCLPHRNFLLAHFRNKETGTALWGRRVMLSEKLTQRIYLAGEKAYEMLTPLNLLLGGAKRMDASLYLPFLPTKISNKPVIWGCNWSIHKSLLLEVNGFDENYNAPGMGEDTDIEWRLLQKGVLLKKIKNQAIQYHLYHPENYSSTKAMEEILHKTKQTKQIFAQNGLIKNNPENIR